MIKMIMAGGLMVVLSAGVAGAAPEQAVEVGQWSQVIANIKEAAQKQFAISRENKQLLQKQNLKQAELIATLNSLGFAVSRDFVNGSPSVSRNRYKLIVNAGACWESCEVYVVVGGIDLDNPSNSKPRLEAYRDVKDNVINVIYAASTIEFMEKTRDGALIEETIAKLKEEVSAKR